MMENATYHFSAQYFPNPKSFISEENNFFAKEIGYM